MNKDIVQRLKELFQSLEALALANEQYIKTRKSAYMLLISGQLRALVGIGNPRSMHPLLLELSEELNIPLKFYSSPQRENPPPHDLGADIVSGRTWFVDSDSGLREFNLRDWLQAPRYFDVVEHVYKSPNSVLRAIAEKHGAAHYDHEIASEVDTLTRHSVGYISAAGNYLETGVNRFLLDAAALIFWLGMRLYYIWDDQVKGHDPCSDSRIQRHDEMMRKLII